jgi:hypothetical protein
VGVRAGIGNLSAPWIVLPLLAGRSAKSASRGALIGFLACLTALVGFYGTLAATALAGHLGGGGLLHEFVREASANRIYFVFGAVTGPVAGGLGAVMGRRPRAAWLAAGAVTAGEIVAVAIVHGRQILPAPLYFSWAVDSWTPYLVESGLGLAIVMAALCRPPERHAG